MAFTNNFDGNEKDPPVFRVWKTQRRAWQMSGNFTQEGKSTAIRHAALTVKRFNGATATADEVAELLKSGASIELPRSFIACSEEMVLASYDNWKERIEKEEQELVG